METIIGFVLLGFIVMEMGILMFCEYWRELHPWKWFFVKTVTTVSLMIWFCLGKEHYESYEIILTAILGIVIGIDFTHTYITSNNSKMID